jgi:hypothetical protein
MGLLAFRSKNLGAKYLNPSPALDRRPTQRRRVARPRKQSCVEDHGANPPRNNSGACKLCATEYRRQRRAAGIDRGRGRGNRAAQRKRSRDRKRAVLAEYRAARGCRCCDAREHLHFHHRDPATKVADLGRMVDHDKGWEALWAGVAKCDVLCSSCHTAHHYPGARRRRSAAAGSSPMANREPGTRQVGADDRVARPELSL